MSNGSVARSPASADELIAFIVSVVKDQYDALKQPTDGALLAERVRSRWPDLRFDQFGFVKLADAVAHAESEGLLVRNRRVKHLEVLLAGTEECASSVAAQLGRIGTPHIRPDIWRAFVFVAQGQRYCYDRQTSNVVNESSIGEPADAARFVSIPSLSLDDQRQWMKEFVGSNTKLDPGTAPIEDQYCFTKFPIWLANNDAGLDRAWKQYRVHRVAERIRQWSQANSIDPTMFFSAPIARPATVCQEPGQGHEQAIRNAIIMAARDLPLRELENLAIPLRYVMQALKIR
jgi:hypothetical protein